MATNIHKAEGRRRAAGTAESESQRQTEDAGSRTRIASESPALPVGEAATRGEEGGPSRQRVPVVNVVGPGDEEPSDIDFDVEEDELQYYAEMAQDKLDRRVNKLRTQVSRKRKERELMSLRKELRGESTTPMRVADETLGHQEPASKRRRLSEDDIRSDRAQIRPAEPLYYSGKSVRELENFLTFWLIHWESQPEESQATRVRVAAKYLRGIPMKLWGQRVVAGAPYLETWDQFTQWLRDSQKAPNQRILESTLALKELRQQDNQTCRDVYVRMCELENNIPTMDRDQQRAWTLVNALDPKLRSRIVRDLQSVDSVEAVLACAGRNEFPLRGAGESHATDTDWEVDKTLSRSAQFDRSQGTSRREKSREADDQTHARRSVGVQKCLLAMWPGRSLAERVPRAGRAFLMGQKWLRMRVAC